MIGFIITKLKPNDHTVSFKLVDIISSFYTKCMFFLQLLFTYPLYLKRKSSYPSPVRHLKCIGAAALAVGLDAVQAVDYTSDPLEPKNSSCYLSGYGLPKKT